MANLSKYPSTDLFSAVDTICVPHMYCITPKHVGVASDHFGGMLTKEAIIEAERNHGARCDICKGKLSYDQHETALLIECKGELESVREELQTYLLSIKEMAVSDGFAGFAFKKHEG